MKWCFKKNLIYRLTYKLGFDSKKGEEHNLRISILKKSIKYNQTWEDEKTETKLESSRISCKFGKKNKQNNLWEMKPGLIFSMSLRT